MLDELHVHNYAIIEKLQVRFAGGLNVLTGETGAGKSILIGALGLLLGDRTDTSIVRAGAEETAVSGVVSVPAGGFQCVLFLFAPSALARGLARDGITDISLLSRLTNLTRLSLPENSITDPD